MTPSRFRTVAALPVVAVLVLAGGCGGSADKDDGGGFAKQSGDKIAADARADMEDLDAVKINGEIASGDDTVSLDVQASSAV